MGRALLLFALAAAFASRLPADFSYRQVTTISGIAAVGMAGLPGQPAAPGPIASTIAVKDGRLLSRLGDRATVIDLSAQTVTEIDFGRRTFSVAGFDEIRRAMSAGAAALKPVNASVTGERRQISGFDATELAMKLEAPGAETGPATRDLWLARPVAGYAEMRDVLRRLSSAVEWSPLQRLFIARPEVVRMLAALFRETALAEGMPVLEVTAIEPPPGFSEGPARLGTGNPLGQLAGRGGDNTGLLFHIRTEMSAFSSAPLDEADFTVPPSFRRVPAEILQPAKK